MSEFKLSLPIKMVYIPDSNLKYLSEHQFKSTGYSVLDVFLSKFIWEPLVSFFPRWLAPNLITVIGLVFMMASYLIMLQHDDSFLQQIPETCLYVAAFCQFMYQTLDACDGKQARRLKVASPLGMLMDHGCDSLSTTFILLAIIQAMNIGINQSSLLLYITVTTGFFVTHYEEYHTHFHRTHMYNWGVTECQWLNIFLLILTGIYSPEIWKIEYFGLSLKELLVYSNSAIGILITLLMVKNSLFKAPQLVTLLRLMPIIMQDISLYYWFENPLIRKYGPVILITHGLILAEYCSKLIICSAAKLKFNWAHSNVIFELAVVLEQHYFKVLPSETSLYIFVIIIAVRYTSFVCSVVLQLASFLDISVFKVKTQ